MIKLPLVFLISVLSILNYDKIFAQVEELGKVKWGRNLEQAQLESKISGKPILIIFQEIPGCSTCKGYGNGALSHPLIVEAIETYFIPLAIHNNKTGKDKEVLDFFKEPSWNNPVVRIVDNTLKDICDRLSDNYTSFGLVSKINSALIKKNIVI
ncbi:MAG: thioredoxin family protein, partial [Saprospiraceae bacterium]